MPGVKAAALTTRQAQRPCDEDVALLAGAGFGRLHVCTIESDTAAWPRNFALASDHATGFIFGQPLYASRASDAAQFVGKLVRFVPHRIRSIETPHAAPFFVLKRAVSSAGRSGVFTAACRRHGIEHVEADSKWACAEDAHQAWRGFMAGARGRALNPRAVGDFILHHNFEQRSPLLGWRTPYEALCLLAAERPHDILRDLTTYSLEIRRTGVGW